MSKSMNLVLLIGNLGKDAETKFTPSGIARTTFSIATSRRFKAANATEWTEQTDWHNIVAWRAENLAQYLVKGQQVSIRGRIETRKVDTETGVKYFTQITAEDVILLGGNKRASQPADEEAPAADKYDGQGVTDDDVPF